MRRAPAALLGALAALLPLHPPPARAEEVPEEVKRKLVDPDPDVRAQGLKALKGRVDEEAAKAVVALLDDRDPYCRDYACWTLFAHAEDPAAVKVLADKGPRSSTAAGRLAAADALAALSGKPVVAALLRLTQDRDPRTRETAYDALGRLGSLADPATVARLDTALLDAAPGPRAAALEARVALKDPAAPALLEKAATDPDPLIRTAAVALLARADPARAAALFDRFVGDADWGVRISAARAVPLLPDPPPIEALAALLEDPRMRVSDVAHDALRQVSGLDLPPLKKDWLDWWTRTREHWHGRNRGTMRDADRPTAAHWHGLPFRSDSLLFLVDLSGSMEQPGGAVDARPRIAVAKEELARTLNALPDRASADLMAFMLDPSRALGKLQPLGGGTRDRIIRWFGRQEGGRRGDMGGAIVAGLADPEADTLLLLGDGEPSAGDCLFRERILERIRQGLRLRPKAIHCIAFGAKPQDRRFLEEIAARGGGLCIER